MALQYSILVTVDGDEALANVAQNLVEALNVGARSVNGVIAVSVDQLVPGVDLYPDTQL